MIDAGYLIGWIGLGFGVCVAPPQLRKIIKSGKVDGISFHTYLFLTLALSCYLAHALYINSIVFTVAQASNLVINSIILNILWRHRNGHK